MAVAPAPASELASAQAIRERCGNITRAVHAGHSRHFRIDRERLPLAARVVGDVVRRRYGDGVIPYHSRWRHFAAGGVDRKRKLDRLLEPRTTIDRLRAHIDLAVVSVLLDAGAGAAWRYREEGTRTEYTRSEGLGVATFDAFVAGVFSATPGDPLRVDAAALRGIDAATLARAFQLRDDNPLVGVEGRAALLRRLGDTVQTRRDHFGPTGRSSALFHPMLASRTIAAPAILAALLEALGPIWRAHDGAGDTMQGDVWRHPHAGGTGPTAGCVPFHKLTQWLTYSLFEPFEWAGYAVTERDALTALPEYRNGGLLIDTGVLALVDPAAGDAVWDVGSELVVEWRALTVTLIDDLAQRVRAELGRPDLPLACILEGGTWAAGRELAAQLRGGEPPLRVKLEGTVF